MIAVALNRKERSYIMHGLSLYEKEIRDNLKNQQSDDTIYALTKHIEDIGAIKERLKKY